MSDFSLNHFNMDDHGFEAKFVFPQGDYRAVATRVFTEKFDTNGWVGINWVVTDGPCKNREFFQFLQLNNNPDRVTSEARIKFARDMLANTFRAIGFSTPPADWEEVVGHFAILSLEDNEYNGRTSTQLAHIDVDPRGGKPGPAKAAPTSGRAPAQSQPAAEAEDFDDDLPF